MKFLLLPVMIAILSSTLKAQSFTWDGKEKQPKTSVHLGVLFRTGALSAEVEWKRKRLGFLAGVDRWDKENSIWGTTLGLRYYYHDKKQKYYLSFLMSTWRASRWLSSGWRNYHSHGDYEEGAPKWLVSHLSVSVGARWRILRYAYVFLEAGPALGYSREYPSDVKVTQYLSTRSKAYYEPSLVLNFGVGLTLYGVDKSSGK